MHTPILALAAIALVAHTYAATQSPAPGAAPTKAEEKMADRVFLGDVEALAKSSTAFRRVLHTGSHAQLVLMSLDPGQSIGLETHQEVDQCFFIVDGKGEARVDGKTSKIDDDSVVCVPAGVSHDIVNGKEERMKVLTVYAPPQHPEGTVHETKADAQRAEAGEHGEHGERHE